MKISIEQILDWDPCKLYNTREKIIAKTDEHWPKTLLEIADLNIPIDDKFWVLLRSDAIDEKSLHLLACDFAEHMLPVYEIKYPDDNRPRKAIETKRLWVRGEATNEELIVAKNAVDAAAADVADYAYAADAAYYCAATHAAYCAAADAADAAHAARAAIYAAAHAAAAIYAAADAARAAVSDYNTEREWQLERVKEVLKEIEK